MMGECCGGVKVSRIYIRIKRRKERGSQLHWQLPVVTVVDWVMGILAFETDNCFPARCPLPSSLTGCKVSCAIQLSPTLSFTKWAPYPFNG